MKNLLILAFSIVFFTQINAQTWSETAKVVASDRGDGDLFGWFVSVSGNYAIAGAPFEDAETNGDDAGAAYIFEKNENGDWQWKQKIVASERLNGEEFGYSVQIDGDFAIVGACKSSRYDSAGNPAFRAGSAYIFERDQAGVWEQSRELTASDRAENDFFGFDVSIDGNYAIVGALYADVRTEDGYPGADAGSAYIFERDENGNWNQEQKLAASDRSAGDMFGVTVDMDGKYAIVGAWLESEDTAGGNSMNAAGSAYIFEKNETGLWTQTQKITASDREEGSNFGVSVALDGNYAIVGAYSNNTDAEGENFLYRAGAAYLFEKNGNGNWYEVQKIVASDRAEWDIFGVAVSISEKYALVGKQGANLMSGEDTLFDAGAAYLFKRNVNGHWEQTQKFTASDAVQFDQFGASVAIDGEEAFVGAYRNQQDENGENPLSNAGSAYFFSKGLTGFADKSLAVPLTIYPNPTTGKLFLKPGNALEEVEVIVRNAFGQIVFKENYRANPPVSFEIEGPAGLYFVEIRPVSGTASVLKVIKK